ncbi:MAG TPA: hypothetical protein VE134_03190 [Methanomicrobiales archaeon]|nr:hypothetical protein [Methanomicrobiales archaeon]
MPPKKNFSIGITINLDNYESLRLDVEGEIEGERDAEDLISFLDGILSRLGRGNAQTASRVDSYRSRVFTLPEKGTPREEASGKETPPPLEKRPAETKPAEKSPAPAPVAPVAPVPAKPAAEPAAQPVKAERPSIPKEKAAESAPPSAPAEYVCSECQAPVTKGQHQMSQLFTGRTLCKKCMKSP